MMNLKKKILLAHPQVLDVYGFHSFLSFDRQIQHIKTEDIIVSVLLLPSSSR